MARKRNAASNELEHANKRIDDADAATATGTGTGTAQRGRSNGGRKPNASTTRQEKAQAAATLEVVEETQPSPPKRRRRRTTKAKEASAKEATALLLDTFDIVAGAVHPQAPFQPAERVIIEDPLARIMARADSAKLGRYVNMVDPLLLGVGLFLYAQRVAKLAPKKTAQVTQTLEPTPETDPRAGAALHQVLKVKDE